jgi:hypothetical protein
MILGIMQSIVMLSAIYKPYMLSDVILNVVMLRVVMLSPINSPSTLGSSLFFTLGSKPSLGPII